MKKFVFGRSCIIMGENCMQCLKEINVGRAFIVTGHKSMIESGIVQKAEKILSSKGYPVYIHSGITKSSGINIIMDILDAMKKFKPDTVIALGGGSVIDAAKILTIIYENQNINFKNILSFKLPTERKYLKLIAIPSTSGTGSEVTRSCLMCLKDNDAKIKLKTPAFIPDVVILDPTIPLNMPFSIAAQTGMIAISHVIECYLDDNLNDISECLSRQAIKGLFKYLPLSCQSGDIKFREKVQNYVCISGLAFNNVSSEIIDAISASISVKFNLNYGLVNAIVLPYFLEYSTRNITIVSRLKELSKYIGVEDFINSIKKLNSKLSIPKSLKEVGIDEKKFENNLFMLVQNLVRYFTKINHIKIPEEDIVKILKYVYYGHDIDF